MKLAKLDINNNKNGKYIVMATNNSAVYIKKLASYIPELYNLVLWKSYLEEKNT